MKKKKEKKVSYEDFLKKKKAYKNKLKKSSPKQKKKLLKDTDKDGLSDYEEKNIYGTNPLDPDTDKDGMKDGEEVKKGRNPLGKGKLKDLFIPHHGNNFEPQILSKKRVVYHAIGIIITKIVIASFLFVFPVTAWMTPDLAAEESREVISLTNNLRSGLGLSPLTEEQKLNQAAFSKAKDMLAKQYFAHTNSSGNGLEYWISQAGYKYSVAGENLSMGYATPEEMVGAWKQSPTHYKNIKDTLYKDIGVAIVSGPFEDANTIFAVQHFARPKQVLVSDPETIEILKEENMAVLEEGPELKSTEIIKIEKNATIEIIETPDKEVKLLTAKAELPSEVKSAVVNIKNEEVVLEKQEDNTWIGEKVIYKKEENEITKPLVPATIEMKDGAGNIETADIAWKNIEPKAITRTEQYSIYKQSPTKKMNTILNISSIYYKIILSIAFISLLLSVFIEIRKQHPRLILRSLGFIALDRKSVV